jgi:hypothetical protein
MGAAGDLGAVRRSHSPHDVAEVEAGVIETADVIETIGRGLESAKRQCQGFADLLGAAKARLLFSTAVIELARAPLAPVARVPIETGAREYTEDERPRRV